jgi:cellulose synthase/poly-beta-1,6-N-acetylglucosamine synthase-like glycosyltransferase
VRLRARRVCKADIEPSVSLIISAYNEAAVIARKLQNSLSLDYPENLLEIVVVSDASTDGTDDIVNGYSGRVRLLRLTQRSGKTLGLNRAAPLCGGEILLFSDANILYDTQAVRRLVRNFADPAVGCVSGDSRYLDLRESAAHRQEDTYWGYERFVRGLESSIGSTVGGDGAIFAIRKELFLPLEPEAINDLVTPLQIVARGHRAVYEPEAVGYEPSAGDFHSEFRRKRRIVNRSWRGVMSVPSVLSPFKAGLFAWQVLSHKILRWLVLPLILVAMLGCAAAAPRAPAYQLALWGFLLSVLIAGSGVFVRGTALPARLAHAMFYFYLVNVAAVIGIARALTGRIEMQWSPERG